MSEVQKLTIPKTIILTLLVLLASVLNILKQVTMVHQKDISIREFDTSTELTIPVMDRISNYCVPDIMLDRRYMAKPLDG